MAKRAAFSIRLVLEELEDGEFEDQAQTEQAVVQSIREGFYDDSFKLISVEVSQVG